MFDELAHYPTKDVHFWPSISLSSVVVLVILGLLTMPRGSLAEEVACPPGRSCETPLTEKLSNSLGSALYVLVGKISKAPHKDSRFERRIGIQLGLYVMSNSLFFKP